MELGEYHATTKTKGGKKGESGVFGHHHKPKLELLWQAESQF
jgi:hypothetical protein